MSVLEVQEASEIEQHLAGEKPVVLDFFATWCGPCRVIAPKFKEFAGKFTNITFISVDVDKFQSFAASKGVSCMPTFQLYKAGKKIDEVVGAATQKLEAMLEANNK